MKGEFSPLNRLTAIEQFGAKLWESFKKYEEGIMDLRARVKALEDAVKPVEVNYGRIYDTLREIEIATSPLIPDQTQEQWEASFIEKHGTKEQFINERKKKEV